MRAELSQSVPLGCRIRFGVLRSVEFNRGMSKSISVSLKVILITLDELKVNDTIAQSISVVGYGNCHTQYHASLSLLCWQPCVLFGNSPSPFASKNHSDGYTPSRLRGHVGLTEMLK
jgi:hypothetical protein